MKSVILFISIFLFMNLNAQGIFISTNIGYNFLGESNSVIYENSNETTIRSKVYRFNLSQGVFFNFETGYEFANHLVGSLSFSHLKGSKALKDDFKGIPTLNESISSKSLIFTPRLHYKTNILIFKPMFGIGIPIFKSTINSESNSDGYIYEYTGDWQFGTEIFGGIEYTITDYISLNIKANYINLRFRSNNQKIFLNGEKIYETDLKDVIEGPFRSNYILKGNTIDFDLSTFGVSLGANIYF